MQATAAPITQSRSTDDKPTLIRGSKIVCPNCEQEREPLDPKSLKRLDRSEKYAHELNVVYQCVKSTGGCGHVFSPGDNRIMMAFLAGDLVPAEHAKIDPADEQAENGGQ